MRSCSRPTNGLCVAASGWPTRLRAPRRAPDRDRLRLPLRLDGLQRLEGDRRSGRAHRRLVDDAPADRCRRLQPRGGVHDVARDDSLAALGTRTERDDGLTRRHRRADGELEPFALQFLDRLQDPEGGAHGPLGVVLVRDRRAEDGHHGVADELLDRPAEALDVGLHALVVRP